MVISRSVEDQNLDSQNLFQGAYVQSFDIFNCSECGRQSNRFNRSCTFVSFLKKKRKFAGHGQSNNIFDKIKIIKITLESCLT